MVAEPRLLRPRIRTFADLVEERLRERLGEQRARGLEFTGEGADVVVIRVPGGALLSPLLTELVKRQLHGFHWWVQRDGRIRVLRPLPGGDHGAA